MQIFDGLAPWITHLAYLEGGHMLKGAFPKMPSGHVFMLVLTDQSGQFVPVRAL